MIGFDFSADIFSFQTSVGAIDSDVTGSLSTASFDNDLTAAINASALGAGNAVLFQANAGTLSGHTFLIVDANNTAGYQAGLDHVIELVSPSGGISLSSFAAGS